MMKKLCSCTNKPKKSYKMHQRIYVTGYPIESLPMRTKSLEDQMKGRVTKLFRLIWNPDANEFSISRKKT